MYKNDPILYRLSIFIWQENGNEHITIKVEMDDNISDLCG